MAFAYHQQNLTINYQIQFLQKSLLTTKIKKELSNVNLDKCCQVAKLVGFLDCCNSVYSDSGLLVHVHNDQFFGVQKILQDSFLLQPQNTKQSMLIGDELYQEIKQLSVTKPKCEFCNKSYLMGAFCGCGSLSVTNGYSLQFSTPTDIAAKEVLTSLRQCDIFAKTHIGKKHTVYIKDSQTIADLLVLIGAVLSSLEFNNIVATADMRKNINRATNCINANIDKALSASFRQVQAINQLIQNGQLQNMDTPYIEAAQARLKYPEYTLEQLATVLKISKSGTKHRLDKIVLLHSQLSLERK